jgi:DNA modification methylase
MHIGKLYRADAGCLLYQGDCLDLLIRSLTREGDWVLDPFMGSGTTVVAALMNGRRAAGADLRPDYVAAARNRLELGA